MDCKTFQESEIDALYGELDAEGVAAMAEHAATCASCAARYERLKETRDVVLSVAIETVPSDFESRVMAAVDVGLANRAAAPALAPAVAPAPAHAPTGGAKILKFMSRPAFAVAATFVLVLGGAAFVMTQSAPMKDAARSADNAPAASAFAPMPVTADDPAQATAAAATASAFALSEQAATTPRAAAPAIMPPSVVAANEPPAPAPTAGAGKAAQPGRPSTADDRAYAAAKGLYAAGRYAEALPKFEALKATNPEADLYAARCIAKTRGCATAASRFDTAAETNAGTEAGNRATLEGAKCYQANGELAEARKRYSVAKDEDGVAAEAKQALESLDHGAGGAPAAGARAAPKARPAPMPAAAPPPASPAAK